MVTAFFISHIFFQISSNLSKIWLKLWKNGQFWTNAAKFQKNFSFINKFELELFPFLINNRKSQLFHFGHFLPKLGKVFKPVGSCNFSWSSTFCGFSRLNPIPGGEGLNTSYSRGGGAILHTPINFWTTGDTELKFYMLIDIHKLFWKKLFESADYAVMTSQLCKNYQILGQIRPK